jgi:hypothetical protein
VGVVFTRGTVNHISEDLLEGYARLTLSGRGIAPLEDHLMICPECQDRLQSVTAFVVAMRATAQKNRHERYGVQCRAFTAGGDSGC